jgi:AmmeMemoRadiSam system protein A
MELRIDHAQALVHVAIDMIRSTLAGRPNHLVGFFDQSLYEPAGCFVSLHRHSDHALRGCVGRFATKEPLIEVVRASAASALQDPRFLEQPITPEELPSLEIELSVLSPLKPKAHSLDFDPKQEGIYLLHEGRSGCFLPQVARQTGWTREQLLDRLCSEKMGLPATAWKDKEAKLLTFTAQIIGPVPFPK